MKRQNNLLARLKEASGIETITNLSISLGIRMSLIFDWQRRNHIPEAYHDALRASGIDPHWVMAGEGNPPRP